MSKLASVISLLVYASMVTACGGGDESEDEAQRAESSENCEEVCDFWAECNNRQLERGVCAEFCDDQAEDVTSDCLALYAERTSCEADNLNCSDRLGTACEAEFDAYYDCESGGETPASPDDSPEDPSDDRPSDGPGDGF